MADTRQINLTRISSVWPMFPFFFFFRFTTVFHKHLNSIIDEINDREGRRSKYCNFVFKSAILYPAFDFDFDSNTCTISWFNRCLIPVKFCIDSVPSPPTVLSLIRVLYTWKLYIYICVCIIILDNIRNGSFFHFCYM